MKSTGTNYTRGLRLVTAVTLGVLLTAAAAVAGERLQRDERRTVDVGDQTRLVVRNGRGQTVIVGNRETGRVTIVANLVVSADDPDEARSLMERLTFDVSTAEDDVVVETRRPEHKTVRRGLLSMLRGSRPDMYIDYTIEVPNRFAVAAWTTSGDVRVSNVAGGAEVRGTSGDVHMRDIGGSALVELTSGSVDVARVGGDTRVLASSGGATVERIGGSFIMQATSGSVVARQIAGDCQVQLITGDFDIDGCLGDVRFQASTGDARILDVSGSINAITSSGDMDVMIVPVGAKEFVLSSSSGDIDVFFPPREDYGFLLDVATSTGSIEGDLAIEVDEINRRHLKGIVGGRPGDDAALSRLIIETASGDVTVAERPHKRR